MDARLVDSTRALMAEVGMGSPSELDITPADVAEMHSRVLRRLKGDAEEFDAESTRHAQSFPAAPMLSKATQTYRQRRAVYGASEQRFADLMVGAFPDGLTLKSRTDWLRYGLFHQIMSKLSRYVKDFAAPHVDSVHDMIPYAAMLEAEDRRALGMAPFAKVAGPEADVAQPLCSFEWATFSNGTPHRCILKRYHAQEHSPAVHACHCGVIHPKLP